MGRYPRPRRSASSSFHKNEVKIDKDVPAQRIFNFSMLQSILGDKGKK